MLGNRLPKHDVYPQFQATDKSGLLTTAKQSLLSLMDDLLEMRGRLYKQSDSFKPLESDSKRPRLSEDVDSVEVNSVWGEIDSSHEQFCRLRNDIVEKWNSKVRIASVVPVNKKFKALNQSVLAQIEQAKKDPRVIERTHVRRTEYKVVGEAAPSDGSSVVSGKEIDTEIFDDGDFYEQLLRQLIEARSDGSDPSLAGLKASLPQMKKQKREIEHKASKGRRVRLDCP